MHQDRYNCDVTVRCERCSGAKLTDVSKPVKSLERFGVGVRITSGHALSEVANLVPFSELGAVCLQRLLVCFLVSCNRLRNLSFEGRALLFTLLPESVEASRNVRVERGTC